MLRSQPYANRTHAAAAAAAKRYISIPGNGIAARSSISASREYFELLIDAIRVQANGRVGAVYSKAVTLGRSMDMSLSGKQNDASVTNIDGFIFKDILLQNCFL